MNAEQEHDALDMADLGNAKQETKQLMATPVFADNMYQLGLLPDLG